MQIASIQPKDIFQAQHILTLAMARTLIGKPIATTNREYKGNHLHVNIFTIHNIETEWNMAINEPMEGYTSRQAYWKSYMSKQRIHELKHIYMLVDETGGTWHRCHALSGIYEHPTFTGSDADRTVFYIVIE
jgi:hypothetical protein